MSDRAWLPGETRLANITVRQLHRVFLTMSLFAAVTVAFLVMVHEVLIAGLLGAVIGAYLRPVHCWLAARLGGRTRSAAALTLTAVLAPAIGLLVYGGVQLRRALALMADDTAEIAAEIRKDLRIDIGDAGEAWIVQQLSEASALIQEIPATLQGELLAEFSINTVIFLFTAWYILTSAEQITDWLLSRVPDRYEALAKHLDQHVHGVLYGAVYSTLLIQTAKGLLILVLCLLFGVPLAVVLALLTFIIGFFPILGSWTIYVPAAGYLLVFDDAPLKALLMVAVGFGVNTVVLTTLVRPRLAAERSHVLDHYWMFIALVAGVYTFGIAGLVVGPIVVGLLKAITDTLTAIPELLPHTPPGSEPEESLEAKVFTDEAFENKHAYSGPGSQKPGSA